LVGGKGFLKNYFNICRLTKSRGKEKVWRYFKLQGGTGLSRGVGEKFLPVTKKSQGKKKKGEERNEYDLRDDGNQTPTWIRKTPPN